MLASEPIIKIKAIARHHGQFLIVFGVLLFAITSVIAQHYWHAWRLVIIFLFLVSGVICFIGAVKRLEPEFSLTLSPSTITYHHKYGVWQLKWRDISSLVSVKNQHALAIDNLPYIGLRIKNYTCLLEQLSPRLANRLIHEQRPLIVYALQHHLISAEQSLINFTPYKLNGQIIKWPVSAFLHHSDVLLAAFGFQLYLPASALDRDINEFERLLRQCKSSGITYTESE